MPRSSSRRSRTIAQLGDAGAELGHPLGGYLVWLRSERAGALYAVLPPLAQTRILRFAGAPINDRLTGNRIESDRRLNRSA
jgi:hypothetical protein